MPIKNILWIAGAAALVGLGVIALAQQGRGGSLEAAEARAGQLARRHVPDSAAVMQRNRDLRAELAERVYFGFDRWVLQPTDAEILDEKISILKADPQARIRIIGHSDERGGEIYNLALGRRRAVAAKEYLVEHGVEASRIETVSAGVGQPLDLRHSEEAWATNRRDEFRVIDESAPLGLRP
ncbi:MAG: peptidoglycan-associated lipoprotein [Gemmatimonadetes bacterium]|nr:MAG: peptidoglycan-associated lipoprotein [Gemmatimonadota bacterium]